MARRGFYDWYRPKKRTPRAAGYKPPSAVEIQIACDRWDESQIREEFQLLIEQSDDAQKRSGRTRGPWKKLKHIDLVLAVLVNKEMYSQDNSDTARQILKSRFGIVE